MIQDGAEARFAGPADPGDPQLSNLRSYYAENQFVILKQLVPKPICRFLMTYMKVLESRGDLTKDRHGLGIYGADGFETLLAMMTDPVSKVMGKPLLPTYSYARLYRHGDNLRAHRDRPGSEYSLSMPLGYEAEKPWPIYLRDKLDRGVEIVCDVGDALLYNGVEVTHWREPFTGQRQFMAFLFFVDAHGPYAGEVYDGRGALARPSVRSESEKGSD